MKFFFWMVFILSLSFVIVSEFASFREYRRFAPEKLISEREQYGSEIETLKEKLLSQKANSDEISRELVGKERALKSVATEIRLRSYRTDQIALFAAVFSFIFLIWLKFRNRLKVTGKTKDSVLEDMDVAVDPPREVYVDEWEFNQKIEGGFKTKKEAIEWLKTDPSLKCDYCGSRMRATMTGKREAVQLATFYKKVPEGAKDLRVVLGTFWFTNPATELKCPSCSRILRR